MTQRRFPEPVHVVTAFQNAHQAASAPAVGAGDERSREALEMLALKRESAQRVARKTVESGRYEDQLRNESPGSSVNRALECIHVSGRRERWRHRNIPDTVVRAVIVGGACSRIPGPLVHRNEVDVGLPLDQRLRAVSVMHVPVNDENPLKTVTRAGIVRGAGDVSEDTESH